MANMAVYEEQARKAREEKMKAEKAAREAAQLAAETEKRAKDISAADRIMMEGLKREVARELNIFIPLNIMNEAFSRMVIHALPHDAEYIASHQPAIEAVNRIFLHHLGGMKYLKECAKQTGSYLLQDFYRIVKENSDVILKDKLDQLQQAQTEAEVDRVIHSGITADQAEKLDNDIDLRFTAGYDYNKTIRRNTTRIQVTICGTSPAVPMECLGSGVSTVTTTWSTSRNFTRLTVRCLLGPMSGSCGPVLAISSTASPL